MRQRRKKNELPLLIVGDSNEGLHAISSKKENVVFDRMKIDFNLRWNIEGKILYKSRWKVRSGLKIDHQIFKTSVAEDILYVLKCI